MSNQLETTPQPLTPEQREAQIQEEISALCQRLNFDIVAIPQFRPDGNGGWIPVSPIGLKIILK